MATLGEKLVERYPDVYGDRDPEELNASAIEKLSDPERAPKTLAHLRQLFPKGADMDDDAFKSTVLREAGYQAPAPVAPPATPDETLHMQRGVRIKQAAPLYQENVKGTYQIQNDPLASDLVKQNALNRLRGSVAVSEAVPGNQRVEEDDDFREMERYAKEQGVPIVNAPEGMGAYFPSIQVQTPGGQTIRQLRPGATYDPGKVQNMPAVTMDTVTGASDPFQRGITQVLKHGVYNPDTKTWADNKQIDGLGSEGFREYGGDVGGQFAQSSDLAKRVTRGAAAAGGMAAAGGALGLGALDKLEEWLNRGAASLASVPTSPEDFEKQRANPKATPAMAGLFDEWAKDNQEESKKYMDAASSLAQGSLPGALPDTPETAQLAGKALGQTAGEVASMFTPTGIALAAKPVVEMAKPFLAKGAQMAAASLEKGKKTGPLYHWFGEAFSNNPSRAAVPTQAGRDILDTTGAVTRNAGDLFEMETLQRIDGKLKEAMPGATPEQIDATLQEALAGWHSKDARVAAVEKNPLVGTAYNVLQPEHESIFRKAYGDDAQYNPYHVMYGQDISKANRISEQRIDQAAHADMALKKEEDMQAVGQTIHPSVLRGSPGISDEMLARMSSDPAYEGKLAALMDEVRAHGDAMSAARAKDPAYGAVAGYASDGTPAMGKDFMDAAGKRWDAAKRLEELQAKGPQYTVVPRYGRPKEDVLKQYIKDGGTLASGTGRDLEKLDAVGGIVRTAREVEEGQGLRTKAQLDYVKEMLPELQKADPHEGMTLQEYFSTKEAKAHMGDTPIAGIPNVNVIREVQDGEKFTEPAEKWLRDNNKVVVYTADAKGHIPTDVSNIRKQNVVKVTLSHLPEEMNGRVFDRRFVQALIEQQNPNAKMQLARQFAHGVDSIFGLSQLNKAVTRGNMGFEARNRTNEVLRAMAHDPDVFDMNVQRLVREVTNAPLGAGGRYIPELGMTAGQAHREVIRLGAVGRGISNEALGLDAQLPGAFWQSESVRKVIDAGNKPGEMAGYVHNALFRKVLFPDLAQKYSTEDGMRFAVMLNEMRKGVGAGKAANTMRGLLIDFGDRNALVTGAKPLIPFIKYYTGALEGVAKLALENPRRFSRVYDVMRAAENWDTDMNGGGKALNKKYKSLADRASGAPMVEGKDGSIVVHRPETTSAEVANLADMASNMWSGRSKQGDKGIYSVLGPAATMYGAAFTGIDKSTDRNVFGVTPDEFKSLDENTPNWLGPLRQAAMVLEMYTQEMRAKNAGIPYHSMLGENPKQMAAYQLAQALKVWPMADIPARALSQPWVQTLLRAHLGTGNPASRSEEKVGQTLDRAARAWVTGVRSSTVDPTDVMSKDQRRLKEAMPAAASTSAKRAGKQGTLTYPY